jgi:hypothetical protein
MIYGVPNSYYRLIAPPTDLRKGNWFWGYGWSRKNDFKSNHTRVSQGFRKSEKTKKKVKSEKRRIKDEWREKKGINRDNKKPNYDRRGPGKWYKASAARRHRRWANQELQKGIWEEMPKSSTYWEVSKICNGECCDNVIEEWNYNYPANDWDSFIVEKTKRFANPWDWD